MLGISLLAVLLVTVAQDPGSAGVSTNSASGDATQPAVAPGPRLTPEQLAQIEQKLARARVRHEPIRQKAIRINELAGNIHSESDARKLVDSVAEVLTNRRHLFWAAKTIRRRVAHAEFEAVSSPAHLIPEQRIVDIWNEYVREIDAPEETLITVAELHSLRKSNYQITTRFSWKNELGQSVWTMPNIYAVEADGQLAGGCRALEALKIIHDMHELFINVKAARLSLQRASAASDGLTEPTSETWSPPPRLGSSVGVLRAEANPDPVRPAVYLYRQQHGARAYNRLVRRLFDELFPAVQ